VSAPPRPPWPHAPLTPHPPRVESPHPRPPCRRWYENGLAVDGEPAEYEQVYNLIRAVPGVTAIGLSVARADAAIVPTAQGLNVMRRGG